MGKQLVSVSWANVDEKLILKRAIFEQDKKTFTILYAKYYPQVKHYIASHVGRVEDAEDLVQDVFVELSKGKGHYDGRGSVTGYLVGMAKKIIRRYRKRKTCSVRTIPIESIEKVGPSYNNQQRLDPVRQISAQELKTSLEDTAAQLPPKSREAIKLRYIDGLSPRESAEKAGCSVHTFCQRVVDAKKALRKYKKTFESKL